MWLVNKGFCWAIRGAYKTIRILMPPKNHRYIYQVHCLFSLERQVIEIIFLGSTFTRSVCDCHARKLYHVFHISNSSLMHAVIIFLSACTQNMTIQYVELYYWLYCIRHLCLCCNRWQAITWSIESSQTFLKHYIIWFIIQNLKPSIFIKSTPVNYSNIDWFLSNVHLICGK